MVAIAVLVALGGWDPFGTADKDVEAGNAAAAQGRFDDAVCVRSARGRVDEGGLAYDRGTAKLRQGKADTDAAAKQGADRPRARGSRRGGGRREGLHVRGEALYNRGNALLAGGKFDDAVEAYKQALRDDNRSRTRA